VVRMMGGGTLHDREKSKRRPRRRWKRDFATGTGVKLLISL
jgi:hypothetical protein